MNTPSHLIMTAAVRQAAPRAPIRTGAFLAGSIAPDLALYALSLGSMGYYRLIKGWSGEASFRHVFDVLYFTNRWWIAAHNLLHAPLVLLAVLALTWRCRAAFGSRAHWLFWFAAACLFHSAVDIATHYDDGPLVLFPFNWSLRVHSPVSYWDPRHYGALFGMFELGLDLVLLAFLLRPRVLRWFAARRRAENDDPR
jgi:membrane-bound metal-dependent hydrolase YbcI (DUF457 family)